MRMTQARYDYDCVPDYRARYYDPTIGRFISEDPIRFKGGVDFYAYVRNNPINLIDPLGLCDTITCEGTARVLQGNAATIGNPGGFSGPSAGNIPVTSGGAAIIPRQWGTGKGGLRPYLGQISGDFIPSPVSFNGVVDVIGGAPPSGFPAGSNVQDDLMQLNPGMLIIELPGAPQDYGVQGVILHVPSALGCPDGTVQVP